MITLPKDWTIYSNSIRDRCRNLIDFKIWGGIDLDQFDAWKNNFRTDEEKYFSTCILDSLIYRSNKQTYSLIEQMLYKDINNLFRLIGEPGLEILPNCFMQRNTDPLIRLVPAITPHSPVTKSSNEILRFMKRYFLISEDWMVNPWKIQDEIRKGVKAFIFIDDFLGTGNQFEDVILESKLNSIIDSNLIVYAPLCAHTQGIDYLATAYPKLKVVYTEKFDKSTHSFFANYFSGEQDEARAFYLDMLAKRGISPLKGREFGYGDLELTFAFEHAAPDNSLQILHMREGNWRPLFNR
jgi:hypothetical protein